nr:right-handed parallel beta-helix repeat-containing protein [Hymenobacter psoromatis]
MRSFPGPNSASARRVRGRVSGLRHLAFLWLTLLPLLAPAQATLRKDLKRDFGAVGDGRANDHAAFQRAADFFNKRALMPAGARPAMLFIPAGTYRVGRQDAAGNGADVLPLTGCRNLRIVGQDSTHTIIRYVDSLRYGAFDPATRLPYESPKAFFTDWAWGARVGNCINLQKCDNVEISGLNLDGNAAHLLVGGHWGDTGIQLSADGIFVGDSRRITLRRLAVHHFGRDGVQVLNHLAKSLDDPNRENILLESSTFHYNGRQGLSLTGVNGLRATNCSFSHTGRVLIAALGKALFSNPGAGVDVEPEGGFASHVRFENCRLVDNAGQGLVSDRYGDGPPTTQDIVFSNCLLWGTTNWSAWVRQTDFRFENCRLYGAFTTGCALAAYATRFVGCTFEDRPYRGQPAYGIFLVDSDHEARRMSFTNCRFVAHHTGLLRAVPAAPDSASAFRVRGCAFVLAYADEPPLGAASVLAGVVFSGDNSLTSSQPPGAEPRADATLSAEAELTNTLTLSGKTRVGATLRIGPGTSLRVPAGAALELLPGAKVILTGPLLVEAGAYFYQSPLAKISATGRGQLLLRLGAIRGQWPKPDPGGRPALAPGP